MKTFDLCILSSGKELQSIKNSSVFSRYNTIYMDFPREPKENGKAIFDLIGGGQAGGNHSNDDDHTGIYNKVDHLNFKFTEENVKNSIANSR